MPSTPLNCWYLTGPTASGKTRVGLELAQLLGAEIISLDSMAVYRGMDIGTAKLSRQERDLVPHHLIDVVEPDEQFSLSQYVDEAQQKMDLVRSHGREVLFVGGTPLYLKAMLRGIFHGPPADWQFRQQVQQEIQQVGAARLHQRLEQVDPLSAAKLHPHDTRRIIRALEVHRLTGHPISHLQTQFDEGRPAHECKVFVLDWPRAVLHRRIDERVERMFEQGLVEEVRGLASSGHPLSRTADQAVGYREVLQHLRGEHCLEETKELVKIRTRRFAKRQMTWFRSLSECRSVAQDISDDPVETARQILMEVHRNTI